MFSCSHLLIFPAPSPSKQSRPGLLRWDSGNFGIYKVGEGEGEVRCVKCFYCLISNLIIINTIIIAISIITGTIIII